MSKIQLTSNIPVVPSGLSSVTSSNVRHVSITYHVALTAALLARLQELGFRTISTAPSTIGGLAYMKVERELPQGAVVGGAEFAQCLRDDLAVACQSAWNDAQDASRLAQQPPGGIES